MGLGLALGAGYLLGRTKKLKLAFALGTLAAGKRLNLTPQAVTELLSQQLKDNPQFKEIGEEIREDLRGVGKAATGALVERQMEALADRLHDRTAEVRGQLEGGTSEDEDDSGAEAEHEDAKDAEGAEDTEGAEDAEGTGDAEDAEDTEDTEDTGEREEPEDRADDEDREDREDGEDGEDREDGERARRRPARKAPAKKTGQKAAAKKAPAKKTGDRKPAAKQSTGTRRTGARTASRGGGSRGGGGRKGGDER
ncbi:DNA primase [Streptomyces sp. NPDC005811]|uniref:DNA primase n=1 Tax=Streptomyces sp. NPDC005811 TaxID=3154565 RepID=UPI0033D816D3